VCRSSAQDCKGDTPFVTGAVGAARIGGGWLVDHLAAARVGVGAHACSLAGAVLLMLNPTPVSAACALGLIGIGYGIVSGLAAQVAVAMPDELATKSGPIWR
jgi:hypothetical protein